MKINEVVFLAECNLMSMLLVSDNKDPFLLGLMYPVVVSDRLKIYKYGEK